MREGYKNTEVGIIPEDWNVARLKDLTTLITDGAHLSPPTEKNGYPIATVENINKGYIDLDSCRVISSKDYQYLVRNNCKPIIGDVLLSKDGTIGITFPIEKEEDVVLLSSIAIIRPQKEKLDSIFLSKSFSSEWFYIFLDRVKAGSALTRIVLRDISKYVFALPPTKTEQTAIATALSDADALINSLEKLIAKKRNIKQGAMQQLLKPNPDSYREGWEVKTLGKICEKITTGKLDANAMDEDGEYRFYTCARNYFFINDFAFDDEALLVSGNGENVGYVHYYKGKFNAYQRTYVLTGFTQNIYFIKIYLDKYLPARIDSEVNFGNTPYIKMGTLTDMKINLPDIQEQTRIATILSDMDAEIQALETKLEKYRKIKLGMMQNLLTGKIRLV